MYPKFYSLQNLSSTDTQQLSPWEFEAKPSSTANSVAYKAWRKLPTTQHCFYSLIGGQSPVMRISDANEPREILGLVADYDAAITDDELEAGLTRSDQFYRPNLVHRTPLSGGVRLIWFFDRGLLLPSMDVAKRFLKAAEKKLHARALLPGLDEAAFVNPALYYDVGHSWGEAGQAVIPWAEACGWLMLASEKAKWQGDTIPLETIAAEVEDRFPGRWVGPFVEGARGLRFWDQTSDNPTAAVVRSTGMQCFTGTEPFVTWASIFGRGFVERASSNRLGSQVDGIWYDSDNFWFQASDKKWQPNAEREVARHFKVAHGLSAERTDGLTSSEIDRAIYHISQNCRIEGAAPFVYMPTGVIDFMGRKVLNTSNCRPLLRAEEAGEWGKGFPYLGTFLTEFFEPREQLEYFLAWLQRFYRSAMAGKLLQGQAVFIAGDPGRGKTLLTNRIISLLVGGHADAARFLLGETNFNRELFEVGLWTIDDCTPGDNAADHKKFSSLIKKCVANTNFEFHAKFRDSCMVQWAGRIIVTGNLDAESLRILPDVDTSILDKLLLFKAGQRVAHFPDRYELEATIKAELPHFAAWLDEHKPSEDILDEDPRYGIRRYHHPELAQSAGEVSDAQMVREMLQRYFRDNGGELIGNTTDIYTTLHLDDSLKPLLHGKNPRWLGTQLGKLEAHGDGFVVKGQCETSGLRVWQIGYQNMTKNPF